MHAYAHMRPRGSTYLPCVLSAKASSTYRTIPRALLLEYHAGSPREVGAGRRWASPLSSALVLFRRCHQTRRLRCTVQEPRWFIGGISNSRGGTEGVLLPRRPKNASPLPPPGLKRRRSGPGRFYSSI